MSHKEQERIDFFWLLLYLSKITAPGTLRKGTGEKNCREAGCAETCKSINLGTIVCDSVCFLPYPGMGNTSLVNICIICI